MDAKVISLRVSAKTARALEQVARARRVTKTRVLLESLEQVLKRGVTEKSSYELGEDLFGRHKLGRRDASVRARVLYRAHAHAKHARR